ncbi:hypothetical protein SmB9_20850 [Sphingosinicella microcystinivorans]|uniref:Membrane dipeptidase (Peptidase family M19) n=2 Tax=Sphingosinicella microcystinivorans TaxID=335406 RepID=A0AAD1D6S2_SPHMI|nr:hypothetical protein SmB9_20850 [Sphingosinicella microcystinivorans]
MPRNCGRRRGIAGRRSRGAPLRKGYIGIDSDQSIAAEMDHAKYPARIIEKVIGGNFDRLFREVWAGHKPVSTD